MRALILLVGAPVIEIAVVLAVIISGVCVYDASQNVSASEAARIQVSDAARSDLGNAFVRGELSGEEYQAAIKRLQL